ncbi:MAG: AAA family ATPase [Deltaproteobacteria bacterium]|nr:AAA family ATPase [Deltaproteobacteria bacterium]MBW2127741.1 AAA family ATPase [Deltaproteobacteria bacterium]MBW2304400.1 AAA family ATPase [Deltaproteobacteria bacterium]
MLIKKIKLSNILSFGEHCGEIALRSLNVLIGPNGSGKSNLIEVVSLLQSAPRELAVPVRKGGGIRDWLWKGAEETPVAEIEVLVSNPPTGSKNLRYTLSFTEAGQRFELVDERLENESLDPGETEPYFFYRYQRGQPVINVKEEHRSLQREDVDPQQSILAQRKDPDQYPELTWLGEQFGRIKIYREWTFGRKAELRLPQAVDAPNDFLSEDCLNLGLVLNQLRRKPAVKKEILKYLAEFYEGIEDFDISVEGGTVQLFLQEGNYTIPATRLSDGTIRYICLLAILCHSSPPPLVCIEEPELGIHTDIIPLLGTLLKEASKRTQLIVTTHSDVLVDELTEIPESILVCEKEKGCTSMKRLDATQLKDWLKKYSLGELWRKGEIGGTRW